jgi:uncharacterized protein YjbJ (UPF0337 family)
MADELKRDGFEDQVEGVGKELKGKARNIGGAVTGSPSEQVKGKVEELKGKAQRKIGETESDADQDLEVDD